MDDQIGEKNHLEINEKFDEKYTLSNKELKLI